MTPATLSSRVRRFLTIHPLLHSDPTTPSSEGLSLPRFRSGTSRRDGGPHLIAPGSKRIQPKTVYIGPLKTNMCSLEVSLWVDDVEVLSSTDGPDAPPRGTPPSGGPCLSVPDPLYRTRPCSRPQPSELLPDPRRGVPQNPSLPPLRPAFDFSSLRPPLRGRGRN